MTEQKHSPILLTMPRAPRQLTFHDHRMRTGRGGPRPRAGRPRGPRPQVAHRSREAIPGRCPVHVTLRVRPDIPRLRSKRLLRELRRSWARSCERGEFRIVHYSIQQDHVHLLVEAQGRQALARGMKSAGARLARAVNRVFARSGPVLAGRFHHRVLRTPREVRRALAYVLLNTRRHWAKRHRAATPPVALDLASSGRWFDGWRGPPEVPGKELAAARGGFNAQPREVAPPRSWLLRVGWRRHGLIAPSEVPGLG